MDFSLQGNATDYFMSRDREVLNAGPARSGKTICELVKLKWLCETFPGSRHLLARETRKALTETVLHDFETKVLGLGHHAIGKQSRSHRGSYEFRNGAGVILHGLDNPENLLSLELDTALVVQAEQIAVQSTYDAILSRLSGNACGFTQATLDVNPVGPDNWIIRRANEKVCLSCGTSSAMDALACPKCRRTNFGRMRHFSFKHTDNPRWYDAQERRWTEEGVEYLTQVLGRLRGVRRKRLLQGLWAGEDNLVLEEYDPDVHRISGRLEKQGALWVLTVTSPGWSVGAADHMKEARVVLDWFGAGADWGFSPDAGVFQVWGYDRYGRRFMVAEVYRIKQQMEWWAGVAEKLYREFELRYIAVDPSAPALKDAFNLRIGPLGTRAGAGGAPMIAVSADNTIRQQNPDLAGIDLMRWGLRDPEGVVRTYFWKDAQREGIDPELQDAARPTSVVDEIQSWVFARKKATDEQLEKPSDDCYDDGLDCARYEGNEGWGRRGEHDITKKRLPANSAGAIHRTEEKLAKARAWREAHGG